MNRFFNLALQECYNRNMQTNSSPRIDVNSYKELARVVYSEIDRLGEDANLNHIDVSKIIHFNSLFEESTFQGDISQWDMSNAITTDRMFAHSAFKGDISNWKLNRLQTASSMFIASANASDFTKWHLPSLVISSAMFQGSKCTRGVGSLNPDTLEEADSMYGDLSNSIDITHLRLHPTCNLQDLVRRSGTLFPQLQESSLESYRKQVCLMYKLRTTETIERILQGSYSKHKHAHQEVAPYQHAVLYLLYPNPDAPWTIDLPLKDQEYLRFSHQLTDDVDLTAIHYQNHKKNPTTKIETIHNFLDNSNHA
jgi:hypothetical protein